ncbi:LLM class flavin-dependent oxidoreductase [Jatrophihabitans fulvus]
MSATLDFGIFHPPYHPLGQNPTLDLHRDLKLIEHLDECGYAEAWVGEHHSGGWETISSPEVFMAAAAQRTKNIRLGAGVVTVPYHHPFHVAERMQLLDHLTRGRVMLGVGAGALASDAHMIGLDPMNSRGNLEAGLEAIVSLLRERAPLSRKADWFELNDAQLHLPAYTRPHLEVAVASTVSPTGAKLSGRYNTSLLSLGLWSPAGADAVRNAWQIRTTEAEESGAEINRRTWRIVGIAFVARTDREAREQCRQNLGGVFDYLSKSSPFPPVQATDPDDIIDELNEGGIAMIGTPERAIDRLGALYEDSGGFGTFLILGGDWAGAEDMRRMYETFAERVFPTFQDSIAPLQQSYDWVTSPSGSDSGNSWVKDAIAPAIEKATADYAAERDAKAAGR